MYEGETEDIIKAQNKSEEALSRIIEANSGLIWSFWKRACNGRLIPNRLYWFNKSNTKI